MPATLRLLGRKAHRGLPRLPPSGVVERFFVMKKIMVSVLAVCVTAVFLYTLYLKFVATKIPEQTASTVIHFPATDCHPEMMPCTVMRAGRQVRFFLPKKALYLQAFPVQVSVLGFDRNKLESVSVRFEMLGMNMGFNQIQLSARKESWYGEAMLPICVSGRSDWKAIVDVKAEEETYRAIFSFMVAEKSDS